jgi:hypothetical protein
MKSTLLILALILSSIAAKCQNENIITATEYDNIKINTTKLIDIKNTLGNPNTIENLLGLTTSKEIDPDGDFYHYSFSSYKISFSSMISSGTYDKPILSKFEILNNNASITIKNVTITIGDHTNTLGNVVFNTQKDNSKSIVYSTCDGCNNFIVIEFNQSTNIITKIYYLEMT